MSPNGGLGGGIIGVGSAGVVVVGKDLLDELVDTSADSKLCFRPLSPMLKTKMYVVWKKYQVFTPVAELLLKEMKEQFAQNKLQG